MIKMKKRILAAILAAACMSASACSNEPAQTTTAASTAEDVQTAASVSEITAEVLKEVPINSAVEKTKDDIQDYFTGMDVDKITDASFYLCASGAYPDEIGVFEFAAEADAESGADAVSKHIERQYDTFSSYTPDEMYKFDGVSAVVSGKYVYYLITSDNEKAREVIQKYIP